MALSGFVLLHRKMLDWEWYDDKIVKIVFLHFLLTARFSEGSYQGIALKPGQTIIGTLKLAERLHISVSELRTAMRKLRRTGEITTKATNRFTIVTISNWAAYQPDTAGDSAAFMPEKEEANNKQTASKAQQRNTEKERKQREKREEIERLFTQFWQKYPNKKAKKKAYDAFYKLLPDNMLLEKMIDAIEKQAQSEGWRKENGRFIPYPASWLLGRRWEDEEQDGNQRDFEEGGFAIARF